MSPRALASALAVCAVVGFGGSCYRLNGISISPETQTFYITQFDLNTSDAPPTAGQAFAERLKQKINTNTRLSLTETDPDVTFVGAIVGWTVTPEAPNPQTGADLNRLTVRVQVDYTDTRTPKNSYSQTFTDFENFGGDTDVLTVQDALADVLFERLAEEAFNKAFSNW